jgi:hypothetical protein
MLSPLGSGWFAQELEGEKREGKAVPAALRLVFAVEFPGL